MHSVIDIDTKPGSCTIHHLHECVDIPNGNNGDIDVDTMNSSGYSTIDYGCTTRDRFDSQVCVYIPNSITICDRDADAQLGTGHELNRHHDHPVGGIDDVDSLTSEQRRRGTNERGHGHRHWHLDDHSDGVGDGNAGYNGTI